MAANQTSYVDVAKLRVGLFIHLDLGWMDHPFSLNSFKIRSQDQIDTIRSLGLTQVRYSPEQSDHEAVNVATGQAAAPAAPAKPDGDRPDPASPEQLRREYLARQRASLQQCERQFTEATRVLRQLYKQVHAQPETCRQQANVIIDGFLAEILDEQDCAIRLLSEKSGDESSLHALNVTVVLSVST